MSSLNLLFKDSNQIMFRNGVKFRCLFSQTIHENLTRLAAIGWSHNALFFENFNNSRSSWIAKTELSLYERRAHFFQSSRPRKNFVVTFIVFLKIGRAS